MNACDELRALAGRLAATETSPRMFLVRLGEEGAGIRRGPLWMVDAALAGRNRLAGRGFHPHLDDDSPGQARHFAGTASVTARLGASVTRWVSVHVRRDPLDSPDGLLSEEAIRFAGLVLSGELLLADTEEWIDRHLCA